MSVKLTARLLGECSLLGSGESSGEPNSRVDPDRCVFGPFAKDLAPKKKDPLCLDRGESFSDSIGFPGLGLVVAVTARSRLRIRYLG